jgi:hypothetical protein
MFQDWYTPSEVEFKYESEKENYQAQLKILPDDWYYRHNKISYKYNSLGHRSVEPTQLSNNYILFTGCSFTEGVGLCAEQTFASIVANKLNIEHYNAGKGGSGPDFLAISLIALLTKLKNNKPKAIVIQWPSMYRFFKYEHANIQCATFYHPGLTGANQSQEQLFKSMIETNSAINTSYFYRHWLLECLKNMEIEKVLEIHSDMVAPVNHWSYVPPVKSTDRTKIIEVKYSLSYNNKDYKELARDLAHPGFPSNQRQAEEILLHLG